MKPVTKHRTDVFSLVAGVLFLLAVLWWLFGSRFTVPLPGLGWLVALALIAFGVLGLRGALRGDRGRRRSRTDDDDLLD
jgi:hypothetical protein